MERTAQERLCALWKAELVVWNHLNLFGEQPFHCEAQTLDTELQQFVLMDFDLVISQIFHFGKGIFILCHSVLEICN